MSMYIEILLGFVHYYSVMRSGLTWVVFVFSCLYLFLISLRYVLLPRVITESDMRGVTKHSNTDICSVFSHEPTALSPAAQCLAWKLSEKTHANNQLNLFFTLLVS